MTYGILIILFFLNIAVGFIIYTAIRLILHRQRALSERVALLEEFILELTPTLESHNFTEEITEDEPMDDFIILGDDALQEDALQIEKDYINEVDETTRAPEVYDIPASNNDRAFAIITLARDGLSPEAIAKKTGYSEGEVLLVLNLHRDKDSLRRRTKEA